MTVEFAPAMLAPALADLRSFAAEVRQVALDTAGALPDALRTIADAAEATAGRLIDGEPASAFDENDLMVIMMLAGYTTGAGGITQAAALVRTLLDEHENDGGNQVETMADAPLNMTDRRRAGLECVRDGRVTFEPVVALYHVDNHAVGNWDRRTFAELRTHNLIDTKGHGKTVTMVLTDAGRAILDPPADTTEGEVDSP